MVEYGIRVFLKSGEYQDFDPMELDDVSYDGGKFLIQDGRWEFPLGDVDYVSQYDLSRDEDGMCWIRGFDTEKDIRESNDYIKGTTK